MQKTRRPALERSDKKGNFPGIPCDVQVKGASNFTMGMLRIQPDFSTFVWTVRCIIGSCLLGHISLGFKNLCFNLDFWWLALELESWMSVTAAGLRLGLGFCRASFHQSGPAPTLPACLSCVLLYFSLLWALATLLLKRKMKAFFCFWCLTYPFFTWHGTKNSFQIITLGSSDSGQVFHPLPLEFLFSSFPNVSQPLNEHVLPEDSQQCQT